MKIAINSIARAGCLAYGHPWYGTNGRDTYVGSRDIVFRVKGNTDKINKTGLPYDTGECNGINFSRLDREFFDAADFEKVATIQGGYLRSVELLEGGESFSFDETRFEVTETPYFERENKHDNFRVVFNNSLKLSHRNFSHALRAFPVNAEVTISKNNRYLKFDSGDISLLLGAV